MPILVTGGAGFIGSHLCEKLIKIGKRVICLDNFNNFYDPKIKEANIEEIKNHPKFTLIRGDILDSNLLKEIFSEYKFKKVVHLAAIAGVRPSLLSPKNYIDTDVKGTVNLLEVSRKYNINNFVFGSSSSVYGINKKLPFNEENHTDYQISPYAAAKKSAELYCQTYYHLYKIPTVVLRFFTVYGPRQRPDMAIRKFTELIINRKTIQIYGDGSSKRDYTYIDDIINGLLNSIQREFKFEIINLGNSKIIELTKLLVIISEELGIEPEIEFLPDQPGDVPITFADISKAKNLLNYTPRINIREGVKRFIEWRQSHM